MEQLRKYIETKIHSQIKDTLQSTHKRVASTVIEPDHKPPADDGKKK